MTSVNMVLPSAIKMAVVCASSTPEVVAAKPFPVPPGIWAIGIELETNLEVEIL